MEETREIRLQALEETALAYARKRDRVQYESIDMTYMWKGHGGPYRKIDGLAPEYATKDSYLFSVCSSFINATLYNAFGYTLCGNMDDHTCTKIIDCYKEQTRYSYDRTAEGAISEKKAIRQTLEAMQTGDLLVVRNPKANNLHVMFYLSGQRIVHCAGSKINLTTGEEKWDSPGAIRNNDRDNFLINMLGDYPFSNFSHWYVINVLDAIDPEKYPMTPWAKSRLKYPCLDVDRTCNFRRYQTVQPGDVLTFTIQLRNDNTRKSKHHFEDLVMEDVIPEHTTLLASSLTADVQVDGNKIRWRIPLMHAGEERIFQYSVRVNDDVKPGDEIVSAGGKIDEIPFNEIRRKVAPARMSICDAQKLYTFADQSILDKAEVIGDGVADWIYKQLGKDVTIPTARKLIDSLYDIEEVEYAAGEEGEKRDVLKHKENPDRSVLAMAVPELLGGKTLSCVWQTERVLEFRGENLYPGDVIVVARKLDRNTLEAEQWTVLGGCKAVKCAGGKAELIDLPYMDVMMATDFFMTFRPYLKED